MSAGLDGGDHGHVLRLHLNFTARDITTAHGRADRPAELARTCSHEDVQLIARRSPCGGLRGTINLELGAPTQNRSWPEWLANAAIGVCNQLHAGQRSRGSPRSRADLLDATPIPSGRSNALYRIPVAHLYAYLIL
jgi:hypothetical protein